MTIKRTRLLAQVGAMLVIGVAAAVPADADDNQQTADGVIYVREAGARPVPSSYLLEQSATAVRTSPEEQHDLALLATQRGMTLDEARARYEWVPVFSESVQALRDRYPDSFAGAAAQPSDDFDAWIAFKGNAPPGLSTLFASTPVQVQVREGMTWSEAELVASAQDLHYALLASPDVADAATDPDVESGTINIKIEPEAGLLPLTAAAKLQALVGSDDVSTLISQLPPRVAVQIQAVPDIDGGLDTVFGGGPLTACTAGFSVVRQNASNERGITTADHCGNSQRYSGRNVLTYIRSMPVNYGDAQWHRSTEPVSGTFYYSRGVVRNPSGIGDAVAGSPVCKFGQTSGATCDEVYRLNLCRSVYCGLTTTFERLAAGGDSGGPWYWGTTAHGIHSGYLGSAAVPRDMFTPVRAAHVRLGVLLL